MQDALAAPDILPPSLPAHRLAHLQRRLAELRSRITNERIPRSNLASLNLRLAVSEDAVTGSIGQNALLKLLDPASQDVDDGHRHDLRIHTSLRRRGHELRLRLDPPPGTSRRDAKLIATIIRAHEARAILETPADQTASALREARRLARLTYLAPDIVTAIFEGRQPRSLNTRTLTRIANLPICWRQQRALLGFA